MKVKINLNHLNDSGLMATVQSAHDFEDECCIVQVARNGKPAAVCREAAKRLRAMADKFDLLAREPEPCNQATHRRINSK